MTKEKEEEMEITESQAREKILCAPNFYVDSFLIPTSVQYSLITECPRPLSSN